MIEPSWKKIESVKYGGIITVYVVFSKFQNQYIEKNMSDNVVNTELELDEWR